MGVIYLTVFCRTSHFQYVVEECNAEFFDGSTWFPDGLALSDGRDGNFRLLFEFGDKPSVGDFGFW